MMFAVAQRAAAAAKAAAEKAAAEKAAGEAAAVEKAAAEAAAAKKAATLILPLVCSHPPCTLTDLSGSLSELCPLLLGSYSFLS